MWVAHLSDVNSIIVNEDREIRWIISAGDDGGIKIWAKKKKKIIK